MLLVALFFNSKRNFNLGRFFFVASLNLCLPFYQWILGPESYIKTGTFLMLVLPYLVYYKEKKFILASVLLSIIVIYACFYTEVPALYFGLSSQITFYLNLYLISLQIFTLWMLIIAFANENQRVQTVLEDKLIELKRSQSLLIEKNKEMAELNYIVAHDLKQPAKGIKGLSALMKEEFEASDLKLTDEMQQYLDLLENRSGKMVDLIHDILDKNKDSQKELIDINILVPSIIDFLDFPMHVEWHIEKDMQPILGDRVEISQVLQNLISNAVKYGNTKKPVVYIGTHATDGMSGIYVRDNGNGISKENHDKIFELFHIIEETQTSDSTGVGLAIVKRIIDALGGTISIVSELGKGAEFRVLLPTK